jgi:hypothetical protein
VLPSSAAVIWALLADELLPDRGWPSWLVATSVCAVVYIGLFLVASLNDWERRVAAKAFGSLRASVISKRSKRDRKDEEGIERKENER